MLKEIKDLRVNYEISGSGEPMLLLHGGGADMISWEEMVPHLSQHFEVYCYDLRGFGRTERPEKPELSLRVWTQDLLDFMDAMGLDQAILVGWSLGGALALNFACEHPERCSVVIPIGAPGPDKVVQDKSGFEKRQQLAESGATVEEIVDATFDFTRAAFSQWSRDQNPRSLEKIREMLLRNSAGDYAELVSALDELSEYGEKLSRLTARVLVICGEEDGRTPPHLSEAIHHAIPGSELVLLPDCGHYYGYEKPVETSRAILDYLKT